MFDHYLQPKIKFMHLRVRDQQGRAANQGGVTVAYQQTQAGFEYAVAQCSSQDNFNKRYGRAKAAGRLQSPHYREVFASHDQEAFYQQVREVYF